MKIIAACGLLLSVALIARGQDNYADSVVNYTSGTGSGFETTFENPSVVTGTVTTGSDGGTPYSIVYPAYRPTQIVGVGESGTLTAQFDTPITNDPTDHADGMDFTIFGNEFFASGLTGFSGTYTHSGLTVWVSADGTNYYELSVPNGYGADDSFPTNPISQGGNPFLPVNPSLTLSSFVGLTEAQALSLYNGSGGGASFSISWAENSLGDPVYLPSVSFIKIQGSSGYGYVDAISRVETVPEPAAVALLVAGGVALFCFLRFRRRRIRVS